MRPDEQHIGKTFRSKQSKRRRVSLVIDDNCRIFMIGGRRNGGRGMGELRDESAARAHTESSMDSAVTLRKLALVESKIGVVHAAPRSLETHTLARRRTRFPSGRIFLSDKHWQTWRPRNWNT